MILTSILSNFLWLDLRESFTLADISKNVCQILHLKRKWSRDRFGIHFWRCRPSKKLSEIYVLCITGTGKSLSEALIFASTNPQYEDRLFIELQVQCMKIPRSNLLRSVGGCHTSYTTVHNLLFLTFWTIFVHSIFSQCSAKRRASDKNLPVPIILLNSIILFQLGTQLHYRFF